jgi:hypothetical protein
MARYVNTRHVYHHHVKMAAHVPVYLQDILVHARSNTLTVNVPRPTPIRVSLFHAKMEVSKKSPGFF